VKLHAIFAFEADCVAIVRAECISFVFRDVLENLCGMDSSSSDLFYIW